MVKFNGIYWNVLTMANNVNPFNSNKNDFTINIIIFLWLVTYYSSLNIRDTLLSILDGGSMAVGGAIYWHILFSHIDLGWTSWILIWVLGVTYS